MRIVIFVLAAILLPGTVSLASSADRPLTLPQPANVTLHESGPIKVTQDRQVVENLIITARGTEPAIEINGFADVTVRNVVITHTTGAGISATSADRLVLENIAIVNDAAPPRGPHTGMGAAERNNIVIGGGEDLYAHDLYLARGSSGIYLNKAVRPRIERLEGYDFRGPFPRGQMVQFDSCTNPTLDTFTAINPGRTAWTEDVVNSYGSLDPVIRNGYIEGVNSPTGVGIMIENGAGGSGGTVENVDVRYWVNGAFSAADHARNVLFQNVRAFDGIAPAAVSANAGATGVDGTPVPTLEQWEGANYRGPPASGQEPFLVYGARKGTIDFRDAGFRNLPRAGRIAWDVSAMRVHSFTPTDDLPRTFYRIAERR